MRASIWAPLRAPDYRRLWAGQMVSVVGDKLNQIAMGIMVYKITGSMLHMGVMLAVTAAPSALFGMVAGAFVDRWERRRTMLVADILRMLLVLVIPFVVRFGVGAAYVIAFLVATVSLFFEPAKNSLVPELVGSDLLLAANSLDNATSAVSELLGLAFAGTVVATIGHSNAFVLDAVTYFVSALFVLGVAHRETPRPADEPSPVLAEELRNGLRYMWDEPVLRDLLVVYVFAVTGMAATVTLGYLLALEQYHAGAWGLAVFDTAITVGILVGSFLVAKSGSSNVGAKFLWGMVGFGALFFCVSLADSVWPTAIVLFLGGIANMWFHIPMFTILQSRTEERLRGRVFAARLTVVRVFTVVGLVAAGALAESHGVLTVVAAVGVFIVVAGAFGWSRPALRKA